MELIGEYDEIDLPPIRAYVIRHCRFACACTHCGAPVKRTAPAVAASTLFGKRIHALAIYLKEFQVFSCKRLRALSLDIFGITISERASMNIFLRSHATFELEAHKTRAILRCAKVVASADASVRIKGAKSYYWVFHCKNVVVNQSDYSRSSRFTKEMMEGHVPEVRIFDRYSAQQNLADNHQTCLAHLVRDTAFAFKQWFTKVFALARDIGSCAASKLAVKKRELKNSSTTFSIR
ncbi:transposase [Paenochrobactrum sp. BZR 588]|uniref:IS66 family transposase n=1 Tax=unclassified Paenochrobactrum TaxID=2639760 RepID=UPI003851ADCB